MRERCCMIVLWYSASLSLSLCLTPDGQSWSLVACVSSHGPLDLEVHDLVNDNLIGWHAVSSDSDRSICNWVRPSDCLGVDWPGLEPVLCQLGSILQSVSYSDWVSQWLWSVSVSILPVCQSVWPWSHSSRIGPTFFTFFSKSKNATFYVFLKCHVKQESCAIAKMTARCALCK